MTDGSRSAGAARRPPRAGRPPHVLVVGDIVTDIVVLLRGDLATGSDTPGEILTAGGGSAANTAAWLAHLGVAVTLVGAVGADPAAEIRLTELTAAGVRLSVSRVPGARTGTVVVLAGQRERTMINDRGANLLLTPADIEAALDATPGATHLHLSGYPLLDEASRAAGRHALRVAARRGLSVSVGAGSAAPLRRAGGPAFLSWVRGADLLVANLDEAGALLDQPAPSSAAARADAGAAALDGAALLAAGTGGAVVVTAGGYGAAWAGMDGSRARVAAAPVEVVDPTGAGDAFMAGLLAAWLAAAGPPEALAAGARLAARAVTAPGGRPVPVRSDLR